MCYYVFNILFINYVFQYLICEVLNFMADILNLYITDVFLGGRFMRYGTQVIYYYSHSPSLRRDLPNPMCTVFPTVTRYVYNNNNLLLLLG